MIHYSTFVRNKTGIHARPARVLVKEAQKFISDIQIKANGRSADAKGILAVMALGAVQGTPVEMTFAGEDEQQAYESLKALFDHNLNE